MSLRRVAALAAVSGATLALAACSGSKEVSATCPRVVQEPETSMIAFFGAGGGHTAKDVVVGGRIRDVSYQCERRRVGVALNAQISFEAQRANMSIDDADLPYFVALVDPDQKLLKEQGFVAHVAFPPGESYRRIPAEKITVDLPIKDQSTGSTYTVVVGFRLTPEQLAFNRETIR